MSNDWGDGMTLDEYIEKLLREGKRRDHADFQPLFAVYGREKIVSQAKAILERIGAFQGRGDEQESAQR